MKVFQRLEIRAQADRFEFERNEIEFIYFIRNFTGTIHQETDIDRIWGIYCALFLPKLCAITLCLSLIGQKEFHNNEELPQFFQNILHVFQSLTISTNYNCWMHFLHKELLSD